MNFTQKMKRQQAFVLIFLILSAVGLSIVYNFPVVETNTITERYTAPQVLTNKLLQQPDNNLYGYSSVDGAEVYFDSNGILKVIVDPVAKQSRFPNQCEINANDYLPMSCAI